MLWHNGEWKHEDKALFTAEDRLRYGDGVFDTALIGTQIIHAQRHYARLIHDAGIMGINIPFTFEEWEKTARDLVQRNEMEPPYFILNTLISRGKAAGALGIPKEMNANIVMRLRQAPETYPPVEAVISSVRRNEGSPLSRIKSCNYGDEILALKEAQNKGASEAIMLNNAGNVACAATSNIFAVIEGELITPPLSDGAMAGITRALLIERMGAVEKTIAPYDLKTAQGLYITNSVTGARIVHSLDGIALPPPAISIDKDFHLHE